MGSIYKLKPEIIDFILAQKRQNSKLSCRKFVVLLLDQFQAQISKSAINSVLKSAQLSSPIGRPVSSKNSRTFKIPEQKKQQIFGQPASTQEKKPAPRPREMSKQTGKEKPLEIYDGIGAIFLKAAEWEVFSGELMGYLISRHLKNPTPQINKEAEAFLYGPIFGLKNMEDLKKYDGRGLWKLTNTFGPMKGEIFKQAIDNMRGFALDTENELAQIFSEAGYFKFILEDNSQFYIDAQQRSIESNNVQSGMTIPVNKATTILSRAFINNVQSVIIKTLPDKEENLHSFLKSFDNLAKIKRIEIINPHSQKIAEYTTIPSKKRTFICGLWPEQAKFAEFIQKTNIKGLKAVSIKTEFFKEELFLREIPLVLKMGQEKFKIRVIHGQAGSSQDTEFSIVTNIESEPAVDIMNQFLLRWPNIERNHGQEINSLQVIEINVDKDANEIPLFLLEPSLINSFQYVLNSLHKYCREHFFPASCRSFDLTQSMRFAYGLGGQVSEAEKCLTVTLQIPQQYAHREELEQAIGALNEADVKDPIGRKLFLKAVSS